MYATNQLPSVVTPVVMIGLFGNRVPLSPTPAGATPMKLHSLEIWSRSGSSNGVVNAISFTYYNDDLKQIVKEGPWGNSSDPTITQYKKIDFVQGVELRDLSGFVSNSYVTSLTVATSNNNIIYSCGKANIGVGEKHFSIPVDSGHIVALFGRADDFLNDAISAYVIAATR